MKKFLKKVLIMALLLSLIVGGIDLLYIIRSPKYGTMDDSKNDRAYIKDVPQQIELCNLGSSYTMCGFNYENFDDEYVCFNFGLTSQWLSYDYRILQYYGKNLAPGAIVFICVSQSSFFGPEETENDIFPLTNERYYRFLPREYIKEYDWKKDLSINYLPVLSASFPDLIETLSGKKTTTYLWLTSTSHEDALKHGKMRYDLYVAGNIGPDGKRIINETEIDAAYQIISLCRELGATPILVTPPFLHEFTDAIVENDPTFYADFYAITDKLQEDTGVEYYDYQFDERFSSAYDLFFNSDHLNKTGAAAFTEILMSEVLG